LEQQKLDFQAVNRALAVLSACTQAVIRASDEIALLQTLCQLINIADFPRFRADSQCDRFF
jgi:hypothetical protein